MSKLIQKKEELKNFYLILIFLSFIFTFTSLPFMSLGSISTSDKFLLILLIYAVIILNISKLLALPSNLIILLIFWLSFNFISTINAENKYVALAFSLNYLVQGLLLVVFIILFRKYNELKVTLLKLFYCFSVLVSFIALIEYFYFYEIRKYLVLFRQKNYEYERVSSLFDNPNHLGVFLSIMFLIGLHFAFTENSKKMIAGNIVIFIALLLSGTRMALVAVIIGFLIYLYQTSKYKENFIKNKKKIILIIISLISILIVLTVSDSNRLGTTIEGLKENNLTEVTGNRSYIWSAAYQIFKQAPYIGVGNGNFGQEVQSIVGEAKTTHSLYISLLVENGLIGFVLFSILLIFIWSKSNDIKNLNERILFKTVFPILLITQITEMQLYNVFTFVIIFWFFMAIPFSYHKKNILH